MSEKFYNDIDPIETCEWKDSINSVIQTEGADRAKYLIKQMIKILENKDDKYLPHSLLITDHINTISYVDECEYPGDLFLEQKICAAVRWNAIMMVLRASKKKLDLGGHLSSFQSSASIYEVCFNHFFKASNIDSTGDLVYFQGHISPGIYSRAFLEGRLSKKQLNNFRQELEGNGLSSYPHPKLMPEFWQFPTVSMGLSAVCSIYQARFLKYLHNRGLKDTTNQTVYVFLGDGEMDEVEAKGLLVTASREKLDNLIFIINCNLQRLDGPVFGNGKIISELEMIFKGSGWSVIKVIWGGAWDKLFKKDVTGKLIQLMNETLDGDYQRFKSKNGAYIRKNFFGKYVETENLVKDMSDEEIWELNRGGHDFKKIFCALKKAKSVVNQPVVVLIHTVKGYGMGPLVESKNIAHQIKTIDFNSLKYIQKKFNIPVSLEDIENLNFISFKKNSSEYNYIHTQRHKLGGYIPKRLPKFTETLDLPKLDAFKDLLRKQSKQISTTIAFVRIINILLRKDSIKNRIVPIIADEARTFGMEGLFRKLGIYNSCGQQYIPQDKNQISYYKESVKGQILQEGINEVGAVSSWIAAATSYSINNYPMIPFYVFYSMFGFQRIGDLLWLAGDHQARGFLIGGTSGRTTLNGEGLQHEDGHSHIHALTIPNCVSYDPAYAYELSVIIEDGLRRMYGSLQENVYFYITTSNENYVMPSMPENVEEGICKGIYKLKEIDGKCAKVQLMGSGAILKNVCIAGEILSIEYGIGSSIYSVTSFTELARDGQNCERWNNLNPEKSLKVPYIAQIMNSDPAVVSTDYMKLYAEQVRNYVPAISYNVLGTDGFGRSDSKNKLRYFFEIDEYHIVVNALSALVKCGKIDKQLFFKAVTKYNVDTQKVNPSLI
ncbi:2-oxo-acid dehydrogenase E1 subunit, homodimerictype [Buchnera aphidicola (Nipponaphis monzeni)]|uniref:Pyruvate dehydrogenase E1 component n=1 Tax=Buchnera aphidicola (Nipponaphis monzeni) TaxID=2495405 RepID=A0A455TA67_9GAMM|nr:pyruvate dehydrogenase (acetyl-transferring), homodimeric type [Buchnera aphidicola]BBI01180.1 2-oxo-acid dehydrogenase E1 subunit, homodimerictype [Buchnera aphidicola (Nipponaphis monzeni)]